MAEAKPRSAPQTTSHLIVLEGPDGVGKTTLAQVLAERLRQAGRAAEYHSFPGRMPGTLGELVYRLHHDPENLGIRSLPQGPLQTLHIAAHVEAIETVLLPLLGAGTTVVLDRYWWSTLVYGRAGRLSASFVEALINLELAAWRGCVPQIAFLIDRSIPWREGEGGQQWQELRKLYRRVADREKSRYRVEIVENTSTIEDAVALLVEVTSLASSRGPETSRNHA